MITRRQFFASTAALAASPRNRPPNVLLIIADEWRAQATSWNGDRNVNTPALDRLAAESISFDNAVSNLPVCCPARASMMTGQYPLTHGVYVNDVELKPNGVTLGETFRSAGYATGYIGKWHLYGSPDGNYGRRLLPVPREKRFGFEYWKACECTHEYNHSLYYEGDDPQPKYWPGYDASAQTDDAIQFIQRQSKAAQPFLLCLSLGPPHFPYQTAPADFQKLYSERDIGLRANVPPDKRADSTKIHRGYYAHMAALDSCFERLFRCLDQADIAGDTIVVFTSDHGDMMLSQGLTTKLHPWDESVRIPLLIRYPRLLGRRKSRMATPFNLPDLMPTVLSLAGLPIPDSVEGSSRIHPPVENAAALLMLPVSFSEARRYGFAEYRGVRTARYTYVRSIHGPWLLYDNQQDPYQMKNLISAPGSAKLRSELDRQLDKRLRALGDEFLPSQTYVARAGVAHYKEVNLPVGHSVSPWGDWESTVSPL